MSEKVVPFQGTKEQEDLLNEVIAKHKDQRGGLMPVLQEAQEIYGYLPLEVQKMIANGLDKSLSEIYGVVTFYSQFSLVPKGKYKISVCMGTACYVKGADKVLDEIQNKLNIKAGGCTEDGLFSIDATRCVGACGLAPVILVNEDVYGKVTVEEVDGILRKYRDMEA
ncbi:MULTISPECIES: NAD(P)H-dependent oxidoreductase subunit E [Breznakia]|uniref:NAD(P)-dependent iron-only hydrogenase diaphorase component iron-sulfur protein n=1 Tax=Breznakia blatticola TaxID=1754012 RepID=A0A4R7ZIC1_9FIRM|nr:MULTISPECIES: NAD(P)H-dependent oxidoreductase subunit E [Breznakia]MDH6366244.1 NADH:ubiquinone oxidoreductase subunit E [Breznakia sp. PH1-1]MDH6403337.1 NADH:ubiquinone oxidoreductase subunit E [Breznakia sp. PF1-11]MDH6411046.1 NADH:ubiquinone oxidoreductase subunit E [Breznakia sp. PFB1-11]MDH6413410.1 NADH:ubiquinone oxidoreductase subunit E [Breznakia sp. PFB1-14]MDH6416175.1 NADH:ubiquinone oxidoreductase subunit E [Breznakia sp. PFB1-4]